jgi:serine/threonine-protein kinase
MERDTLPHELAAPEARLDDAFAERYRRRSTLGQGGMGEVLLSRDARIGRDVAMKIVRARAGAPPDQQARFLREARVQGQLEHPAIVPVYDLGRDPDGRAFFTMKRVNGLTLEQVLDRLADGDADAAARFGRRKLLAAFTQVGMAVDYAHSRGVVHRDLKPANIMLGDFGEVYVLDWGLARVGAEDEAVAGAASVAGSGPIQTELGAVLGTPGYMAPEQARGGRAVDARADVYALGSILFEILTLDALHASTEVKDILAETLKGADARARTRAPERDVPPELEAVCVRATRLEASERYASAGEMCREIERFLDGDRDVELRRQLADGHAAAASSAAGRALRGERLDARREALREVGRALALAPAHPEALDTLGRLLTTPPRALPAEARAQIHDFQRDGSRSAARIGFVAYLAFFGFVPLGLWMGVASPLAYIVPGPLWLASALLSLKAAYRPHPEGKIPIDLCIVSTLAVASTSLFFGPFVLLPSIACINTMAFLFNRDRTRRLFIVGAGLAAILLPLALEIPGVMPAPYEISGRTITIVANALAFPSVPTRATLLVTSVATLLVAALLIAKMRDILTEKEHQLHVSSWQLRQLVPEHVGVLPASAPAPVCVLTDRG